MRKSKVKHFIISIMPIDSDGRKMWESFGWFNPNLQNYISPLPSGAMILSENESGHGSPQDWIDFLKEDHPNWNMTFVYRNKTNSKTRKQ